MNNWLFSSLEYFTLLKMYIAILLHIKPRTAPGIEAITVINN